MQNHDTAAIRLVVVTGVTRAKTTSAAEAHCSVGSDDVASLMVVMMKKVNHTGAPFHIMLLSFRGRTTRAE